MKNYLLIFLLAVISCRKNDSSIPISFIQRSSTESSIVPAKVPPASALLNGETWYADSVYCVFGGTCYPDKLHLEIQKRGKVSVTENFVFHKLLPDTLIQKMYGLTGNTCFNDTLEASYTTWDDDIILSFYDVKNTANNYIQLDSFDMVTKKFSGTFSGTYTKFYGTGVKKILVTNGKFHGRVLN